MKHTKENKKNMEINKNIFDIQSKEDAELFKTIATGRKFFKKGERVIDICEQEIKRNKYLNSGLVIKLFVKLKNKKEKYLIENRTSSVIRAVASYYVRKESDEQPSSTEISNNVKEYLLNTVEDYFEKDENKSKIIDISTKNKVEVS